MTLGLANLKIIEIFNLFIKIDYNKFCELIIKNNIIANLMVFFFFLIFIK